MEAVLMDPHVNAVVSILMLTDETGAPPLDFIVDLARRYPEKPIYVSFSGQKKHMEAAKAFLEPRGVPAFWFAEEALEALSFAVQCREAMEQKGRQEHEA
jgi:acyl-CoA synthetase (NDP forming)